jgi:hypothetical protein
LVPQAARRVSNGYQRSFANGSINKTFPVALKNAGVSTSLVGKYLNGAPSTVPGWSSFMPHVGGGLYYDYKLRVNGTAVSYGARPPTTPPTCSAPASSRKSGMRSAPAGLSSPC